jgi:four helix bundle protein
MGQATLQSAFSKQAERLRRRKNSETDSSMDFAQDCGYISAEQHEQLVAQCAEVGRMLGDMIRKPESFLAADHPISDV